MDRSVVIAEDTEGKKTVVINNICFTGKRSVNWNDVRSYLKSFVGKDYKIEDTNDIIYIGNDLPNEYTGSIYTYKLKGAVAKAKANATQGLPEMLRIAVGRHFRENNNEKHYRNAALGWYRYDSRFALPVYDENGEFERYNVFHASMIVRHDENGRMYLYDVMDIKKKQATRLSYKSCTRHKTRSSFIIIL